MLNIFCHCFQRFSYLAYVLHVCKPRLAVTFFCHGHNFFLNDRKKLSKCLKIHLIFFGHKEKFGLWPKKKTSENIRWWIPLRQVSILLRDKWPICFSEKRTVYSWRPGANHNVSRDLSSFTLLRCCRRPIRTLQLGRQHPFHRRTHREGRFAQRKTIDERW